VSDLFDGMRRARILIPDATPLSLLGLIGPQALNWLFVTGAQVWVADMVREEATRAPEPEDDKRAQHRLVIARWFADNAHRLHIQRTDEGDEYRKAMEAWSRVPGRPRELKPSRKGRGERSLLQALDGVEKFTAAGGSRHRPRR